MKRKRTKVDYLHSVPDEFIDSEWPEEWRIKESMAQGKGYVSYHSGKPMYGKILYSFRLKTEDKWFNCDVQDPKLSVGDHIEFEYSDKNGKAQVNVPSIRRLPGTAEVHQGTSSGALGATATAERPKSEYQLKEEYWRAKEARDIANENHRKANEVRIQYQAARKDAVQVVGFLVANDKLKLPEKNAVDAILGKITDLTERYARETGAIGSEEGLPGVDEGEPGFPGAVSQS